MCKQTTHADGRDKIGMDSMYYQLVVHVKFDNWRIYMYYIKDKDVLQIHKQYWGAKGGVMIASKEHK